MAKDAKYAKEKDIANLEKMEKRLLKMFNQCYDNRQEGSDYEDDAKTCKAAADLSQAFLDIRQQRLYETGQSPFPARSTVQVQQGVRHMTRRNASQYKTS